MAADQVDRGVAKSLADLPRSLACELGLTDAGVRQFSPNALVNRHHVGIGARLLQ